MDEYIIPLFVRSATKDSYVWGENTWNHLRRICPSEGQALKTNLLGMHVCNSVYENHNKVQKKTSDECLIDA